MDSSPASPFLVGLFGYGTLVFVLLSRDLCMSAPYLSLRPIYSATSFIDVEYFSVLYPPEQSNMKPFRSSHCPSNFIGWGYAAVPGHHLQAVLVVREVFVPAPFTIFALACLLIVCFKYVNLKHITPTDKSQGRYWEK